MKGLFITVILALALYQAAAVRPNPGPLRLVDLSTLTRQQSACSSEQDCNEGLIFPIFSCVSGACRDTRVDQGGDSLVFTRSVGPLQTGGVGARCTSILNCRPGLVCISGNPVGKCGAAKGIIGISHLLVNIVQQDYVISSGGTSVTPEQQGPTRTSRAMAIVHLAAHDTYGIMTGAFVPKIIDDSIRAGFDPKLTEGLVNTKFNGGFDREVQGTAAALAAGYTAMKLLYPRSANLIDAVRKEALANTTPFFTSFGDIVAAAWVDVRKNDGASKSQQDNTFTSGLLRHQPDPNYNEATGNSGSQANFGRNWGSVRPFVLTNVRTQAFLKKFPGINSKEYRANLAEVKRKGQCNNIMQNGRPLEDIGVFWGYDGMPGIGVPPRLFLQVVLAVKELANLPFKNQLRAFAAVSTSMTDAGIAAWLWKFEYDLWRPVFGIREDPTDPIADWSPIGVPFSNIAPRTAPRCIGVNPDFPAYPSGHASFGTAAFKVLAKLLSKSPSQIKVTVTSDEFNGITTDGEGKVRPRFTQTINLNQAIEQNKDGRVLIGVHWRFDSDGGDVVGTKVANRAAQAFAF